MAHPMDEVVKALKAASPKDGEVVRRAYDFAEKAHSTELRKSGEPYIVHPAAIALTLAKLGMDRDTVIAGILHDTIEDTPTTPDDIEREFGKTVRFLVESVTKLSKLKYRGLERHVESLRRLLVATANDIRVIIIKLADRLHNMETIEFVTPAEKRHRIAMETMEVYVPIAARLGIGVLKAQLEDLAFKALEPERFQKIAAYLKSESEKAKDAIDEAVETLKKELTAARIKILDIHSRVKGVHSFAMKLEKKGNDIEKVYDTFAIRLILPSEEECYRALGIIHGLWRPVPGRVKDYIATAKTNGYRSIHTTVVSPQKVIIEVQLRTEDMNREAQFGIASHFSYKQGPERGLQDMPTTMLWLSRFIPSLMRTKKAGMANPGLSPSTTRWLKELTEAAENFRGQEAFQLALKDDFLAERMFVFTPKGDVIDLPVGATPIDFAYAIHSDIGDTMMGAKVNGKIMQLTGTLKNGDMVEVITRKSAKPNRKWLDVVKTSSAKHHIRDALNKTGGA